MRVIKPILNGISSIIACAVSAIVPIQAIAQVYNGGGVNAGIQAAGGLGGITGETSIIDIILRIIQFILDIALILAVLAIVIAGIYLITSNGDEAQKDKAKKIIYYVIIGIIVILFSRVIVVFVNNIF